MSNTATQEKKQLFGGWSPFGPISQREMQIFTEVTGPDHIIGNAIYEPYEVSTQVVAGEFLKYKCSVQPVNKTEPIIWEAIVEIFQPLNGKPHLVGITR